MLNLTRIHGLKTEKSLNHDSTMIGGDRIPKNRDVHADGDMGKTGWLPGGFLLRAGGPGGGPGGPNSAAESGLFSAGLVT